MFYKWERGENDCVTGSGEAVIDYTYISEENFILLVLLTSNGILRIQYNITGAGEKRRSISIREFAPSWSEAAAVALIPDASGIALVLTNGNILLVPIKNLIDVPWGYGGMLPYDSPTFVDVEGGDEACLKVPTSAVCYKALYSNRPLLIYSNKAGQIFIIDLTTRMVSVGLGAPQSIHTLQTLVTANSVHLLVTGCTGAQWMVPLEEEGRSLRETIGKIIPSELEQLHKNASKLTATENGKLCLLDMDRNRLKLLSDVSLKNAQCEINVPEKTWLVHYTPNVIFAITEQTKAKIAVHFGITSSFENVVYDELEHDLPEERILGIVPIAEKEPLSSCIVVTERSSLRIVPSKSVDYISVTLAERQLFCTQYCSRLATVFGRDHVSFCETVIRLALERCRSSATVSYSVEDLIRLALEAPLEIMKAVKLFGEYDMSEALLPSVLSRCDSSSESESRRAAIYLFLAKCKKGRSKKFNVECEIREFLTKYEDVSDGLEELLVSSFWSCVPLIVPRAERNSEIVAKFLTGSCEWPKESASHIVRTISLISWRSISGYADELLRRMTQFLFLITSSAHLAIFARIAEQQMTRFARSGVPLYVLASLLLLAKTPHINDVARRLSALLSCGSNCTAVISEDESLVFWGEFSSGSMKGKDLEKLKGGSAERVALPRTICLREKVCSVSCGTEHVLCLSTGGRVYSFGRNRFGQCGVGHFNEVTEATLVKGSFLDVRCLQAGHYHSVLVDSRGKVFSWGWGIYGQLGHEGRGRTENCSVPKLVQSIREPVVAVQCGYAHTLFLTESGDVLACGNGAYGQLGCGHDVKKRFCPERIDITEKVIMIASKHFHGVALTESQKIFQWGTCPHSLKMKVFLLKRLRANRDNSVSPSASTASEKSLETSQSHLMVTHVEHMIEEEIVYIDAGYSHSAILTKNGSLYTWGKGLEMQLGHGTKKEQEEPHQLFKPPGVRWQSVSCGFDFTTAVTSDGSIYVWGRNDKGQLAVQSKVSPQTSRKIIFKSTKGPKAVQFTGESCCIATPHKLHSVFASIKPDVSAEVVSDDRLMEILQTLDEETVGEIAGYLQKHTVVSLPAVLVHLLAGDLPTAVSVFTRLPWSASECATKRAALDSGSSDAPNLEKAPVLDAIWGLIVKQPSFIVQWSALNNMLLHLPVGPIGSRLLEDKKMSALAPAILVGNPKSLEGLTSMQKLLLIEGWQSDSMPLLDIPQNQLQNLTARVRIWNCCGTVEKNGQTRCTNSVPEKRRMCSKCADAWKSAIRTKFSKKK